MYPSERDFYVRQEQYKDLVRAAEQARLIRAADLYPPSLWDLSRTLVSQLRQRMVIRSSKPQLSVQAGCACGDPSC